MVENKTKPTGADVGAFLDAVEPARRREDASRIAELMTRITGFEPQMWGPTIVGYGRYRYRYASGHGGEAGLTGFSPRKAALTVYIVPGFTPYADQLERLGPHTHSLSCLYIKRLDDIDIEVLGEVVADSVERMKVLYPDWTAR